MYYDRNFCLLILSTFYFHAIFVRLTSINHK